MIGVWQAANGSFGRFGSCPALPANGRYQRRPAANQAINE
jgi:hypothetical protein